MLYDYSILGGVDIYQRRKCRVCLLEYRGCSDAMHLHHLLHANAYE